MTNMSSTGSRPAVSDGRKRSKVDLCLDSASSVSVSHNVTADCPSSPSSVHQQYEIPKSPSARSRRQLKLPVPLSPLTRRSLCYETEMKLNEIIKLNRIITIDGVQYVTDISDMEYLGALGNGTCGEVVKMRHNPSGAILAVKQMRRSGNNDENKRILMDLDVVLKSHDCPYIVRCVGCFITESYVWICMELMNTCFDKLIKRLKRPIPEPILGKITVATVKALSYLKEKHGVIHRDVKPSNILVDNLGNVKLCDFGISGRLVDSKAKTRNAGCAAYMAPERIEPPDPNKPDYDVRADVWSLGITLVELATGEFPYKDCKTDFEVLTKVLQEEPPSLPEDPKFSNEFQSFVMSCLTKNYTKRPKYLQLIEHPFIKRYENANVRVDQWLQSISCDNKSDFKQIVANKFVPIITEYGKPSSSYSKDAKHVKPNTDACDKISALLQKYHISGTNFGTSSRQNKDSLIKKYLKEPFLAKEPSTERPACLNVDDSRRPKQPSSTTSPIVLQRFYHQQSQYQRQESRRYPSPSPKRDNRFEYLKPRSTSMTRNLRLQSPEPPPRSNRGQFSEIAPLLAGRTANISPLVLKRNFDEVTRPIRFQNIQSTDESSSSSSSPVSPTLFRSRKFHKAKYSPDVRR